MGYDPGRMIRVVRYHALGPLEAYVNGAPVNLGGPKQRLVLAVLLIEADRVVSDDRLVDELWGDDPPNGARHVIQTYISELRRVLEDKLVRAGRGYRLTVDRSAVDAFRFETLTQAARDRLSDSPAAAASMLREALALWHGEPFGGTGESALVRREIDRLTELRLAAVEDRIAADLAAGRHAQVTPELVALTREHPFRERLHALYMLALYRSDRQGDALLAYHRARRVLVKELGIDPSPDLQALERQILVQDAALAAPPNRGPADAGTEQPSTGTTDPLGAIRGFELRQQVGERGARATFRAYQASVGREVAVAAFRGPFVRRPDFMRSFDLRARTLATLDHPNVVPILDWWRDPDGGFVVTPWLGGGSVRHALQRGPWSMSRTLRLLEQCGGALSAAHRRQLLHGQITTSDILLDADGNALLGGFAMVDPAHDRRVVGSSSWVAPEVLRGEPVTARSDIWGLAAAAIEILTGTTSDTSQAVPMLAQHRNDLPTELVAVLAQASAPAPNDRHERMADFLRDIRRAAGADVVAMPVVGQEADAIRNPYKGLRAFEEVDAADFFGRTALVDELVEAVGQHRFVLLAGPSGSGKSSAIRAGLLPALRGSRGPGSGWLITDLFPGAFPFDELAAALLRVGVRDRQGNMAGPGNADDVAGLVHRDLPHGSELLLVIDQLEELWSMAEDADTRRRFVLALLDAVDAPNSRVRVVASVRTDFLDRVLEEARLGEHIRRGLVLVTPPSAEELAQAVVGPARLAGLEFEPGLVDTIIRDVRNEPGALPLLQHALSELSVRREGRRLTSAAYDATGGVAGALARRAEAVYRGLPSDGDAAARHVFLRLVAVDEQRLDARRRVSRGELRSLPIQQRLVDEVLHQFGAHRLLSFDRDPVTRGPTVEVAHEALFREWATLREWIESRRDDLLRQRGLRSAAGEWLATGESADYLFSGSRLAEAERWRAGTDLALSAGEQSFLSASRVREDELAGHRHRRRMVLQAAAAGVGLVVLTLAALSFLQLGRAEAGEREARARALAAASGVQLDADQDLAVLLAMAAVTISTNGGEGPIPEAVNALHTALLAHRTSVSAQVGGFFVAFAGESLMFSTGGPPGPAARPTIWDPATGEIIRQPEPHGDLPTGAAIGAGGRLAAETYRDAATVVWDLTTGDVVSRTEAAGGIVGVPAISDDGRLLASARLDPITGQASVEMFDLRSGRLLWSTSTERVADLLFGAEDAWLAVATDSTTDVVLLDPQTGERLRSLVAPAAGVSGLVDLSLDPTAEQMALLAYGPSRIEVIDVETGVVTRTITMGAEPNAVCFAAGGDWVVASAADELIHVWSVERGSLIMTLPGSSHVGGLDCAIDGNRVAVSGDGGITRIFDLRAEVPAEVVSFATEPPAGGWWSPDGDLVVSHDSGRVHRYAADGRLLAQTSAEWVATPSWIALSADGRTLAAEVRRESQTRPPTIELFDSFSLAPLRTMQGGGLPLAFSVDGRLLLAGGDQGGAVYEVGSGNRLARLLSPIGSSPFSAPSGAFLPDGRHVVLQAVGAPEAWIYDVATGVHVGTVCTEEDSIRVAVSAVSDMLVAGDHPGWVEAWPVADMLAAARGAPPACVREGTNATDAARTGRWELPAEAGLRFDTGGRMLATTSGFDGRVAVWDFATEERVLELELDGTVSVLGFSPDSRHLAVGLFEPRGSLHAIRILALDPAELVKLARTRVTRTLSDEECRAFLQRDDCSDRPGR